MARVLITGFEPVHGAPADASADAVRILADTWHGPHELIARRLVAAYDEAPRRLRASVAKNLPDAVVVVAAAPGSTMLAIERLAVNLDDASAADAAGVQPVDRPVVPGAEAALWTTLPAKEILAGLDARGIPATLSMSAGTDVANHVFYVLQRELAEWGVPSGLVHVPATPEMRVRGAATVPAPVIAEALRIVVESVIASVTGTAASAPPVPAARVADAPHSDPTAVLETAAGEHDAEADEFDEEPTQAYLMPIKDPIVETPSRPQPPHGSPPVTPTLATAPPVVPTLEPDPVPGPAPRAPVAEPAAPTPPAPTPPLPATPPPPPPAPQQRPDQRPVQESTQEQEEKEDAPGRRPLTWEEIIRGDRP